MRYICTSIVATFVLAGTTLAATINVPGDYPTIQEAVNAAADNDEILVQPGTYTGTGAYEAVNLNSVQVILRSTDGRDSTFISGEDARRAIACSKAGTVIDGFTLIDGNATSNGGGAIICSGDVTIKNCRISNNRVSTNDDGGGIKFVGGSPQLIDCLIENNTTTRNGGGIHLNGCTATLTNCTISSNHAYWDGGGVMARGDNGSSITGCQISMNSSYTGGGLVCWDRGTAPTIIVDCNISNNYVGVEHDPAGAAGGGINCFNSSPHITSCQITSNSSTTFGGGANSDPGAEPIFTDCTFSDNAATLGGGASCRSSTIQLIGCIFNSNVASGAGGDFGGGFWCTNSLVDIQGGQFTGNQAEYGGGISFDEYSQGTVVGSLISGNTGKDGGGVYIEDASTPSLINCVISNNETSGEQGGGVHYAYGSNPTIEGCTITGNTSGGEVGGGIFCANSVGTITDCVISNNDGREGGGIYSTSSSPLISGSTFESNEQIGGGQHGSAIRFAGGGTPVVSDCIFKSNLGDYAIHNDGSETTIDECTFAYNTNGIKCAGGGGSVITNCCFWQTGVAINGCSDGGGNTFDFNCLDSDGDGIPDGKDPCPNDPDNDIDGDGVCGDVDAFPNDPNEWADSDGDGVGDNADVFPNDPNEWADSDGDGVGDNEDTAPRGACCVSSGCYQSTEVACSGFGGTWLGEGGGCENCIPVCLGDLDGNGGVDITDLLLVIASWGACP